MMMVYLMLFGMMGLVGSVAVGNPEVDCQRGADEVGCLPPRLAIAHLATRTAGSPSKLNVKLTTTFFADKLLGTWTGTITGFVTATPFPGPTPTPTKRVDSGSGPEDNLAPNLPPSSRRRRWGLSFGLVAL
jgi:hypothetical protein